MMKLLHYLTLSLFLLSSAVVAGQTQGNSIIASLQDDGNGDFRVIFTPTETLSGLGNPLVIYLRIPGDQVSGTSLMINTNPFGLALISEALNPGDGYYYYYFQSQPSINLGSWPSGVPVTIATFTITGAVGFVELSGGNFGGAISTGFGYFWPGTSLATNNTETNLVSWPISGQIVFPVELVYFQADKEGQVSLLTWKTATELNNDYFQIEHSTDGLAFAAIGIEKGAGTTTEPQHYRFLHDTPAAGINYYRLKQVDYDGAFEYSPVEALNFGLKNNNFQVFPNPAADYLVITPPGQERAPWNGTVYDLQGKRLADFVIRSDAYRLETAAWAQGSYYILIENGARTERLRFVKD